MDFDIFGAVGRGEGAGAGREQGNETGQPDGQDKQAECGKGREGGTHPGTDLQQSDDKRRLNFLQMILD